MLVSPQVELKSFLTFKNYFMHNIILNYACFAKACNICQRTKIEALKNRSFHPKIPVDYSLVGKLISWIKIHASKL